jgi:hypothetical protein
MTKRDGKTRGDVTWLAHVRELLGEHSRKIAIAALFALAGVVADRFSDEFYAWLRSLFWSTISGTYTLQTFTYTDQSPDLVPTSSTVELKDGGGTVFGVLRRNVSGAEYKFFGYHRIKFLLVAYGGHRPLGGGTLSLQHDIATGNSPVFWGWKTSVQCVGAPNPQSFLVECPALMFFRDAQSPEADYKDFFEGRSLPQNNGPELSRAVREA